MASPSSAKIPVGSSTKQVRASKRDVGRSRVIGASSVSNSSRRVNGSVANVNGGASGHRSGHSTRVYLDGVDVTPQSLLVSRIKPSTPSGATTPKPKAKGARAVAPKPSTVSVPRSLGPPWPVPVCSSATRRPLQRTTTRTVKAPRRWWPRLHEASAKKFDQVVEIAQSRVLQRQRLTRKRTTVHARRMGRRILKTARTARTRWRPTSSGFGSCRGSRGSVARWGQVSVQRNGTDVWQVSPSACHGDVGGDVDRDVAGDPQRLRGARRAESHGGHGEEQALSGGVCAEEGE